MLHVALLHLPDFLGYQDAAAMAADHRELVERTLRIKKIGNALMTLLGGREIHPVNVRLGGFYRVPRRDELAAIVPDLQWGLEASLQTVRDVAALDFPDFEGDWELLALSHPDEYPLNEGRLKSTSGLDAEIDRYDSVLLEEHVAHSNALHSHVAGRGPCHVGPLARFALNYDRLTPQAQAAAADVGLTPECRNPFRTIIVRAVEIAFAFEESLRIIDQYQRPAQPCVEVTPRTGTGFGCTEAPRGICYHRYSIDDDGLITDAKIVAPTSVNQKVIEQDLRHFVAPRLDLADEELRWQCEQAIRNYDPCISCATHFLRLEINRR